MLCFLDLSAVFCFSLGLPYFSSFFCPFFFGPVFRVILLFRHSFLFFFLEPFLPVLPLNRLLCSLSWDCTILRCLNVSAESLENEIILVSTWATRAEYVGKTKAGPSTRREGSISLLGLDETTFLHRVSTDQLSLWPDNLIEDSATMYTTVELHVPSTPSLVGWRPSLVGCRPSLLWGRPSLLWGRQSLLGLRPSLLGLRPLLLGRRPSLSGWRPSLLGLRPSLLGWRPLLLGWSPSQLGWRPSIVGWRPSLQGWRPSPAGWRPSLVGWTDDGVVCRRKSSILNGENDTTWPW